MSRPTDWDPLCSGDPVPGDSTEISTYAGNCANIASEIQNQVATLRRLGKISDWNSKAGDTFRAHAGATADDLGKAQGRYEAVASALRTWGPQLDEHQRTSLSLLSQAQEQQRVIDSHSQPQARPAKPTAAQAKQFAADDAAAKSAVDNAHTEIGRLQGQLKSLEGRRDGDAHDAAQKIRKVIDHDGLKDHHSLWGSITGALDHVWHAVESACKNWASILSKIADVLSNLAMILSVIAPFLACIPIIGEIAIGLMVATLALHLLLAATGHGSWVDVGMDAVALVTFGKGQELVKAGEAGEKALVEDGGKAALHDAQTYSARSAGNRALDRAASTGRDSSSLAAVTRGSAQRADTLRNIREIQRLRSIADGTGSDLRVGLATGDKTASHLSAVARNVGSSSLDHVPSVGRSLNSIRVAGTSGVKNLAVSWGVTTVSAANTDINDGYQVVTGHGKHILPEVTGGFQVPSLRNPAGLPEPKLEYPLLTGAESEGR